jgi:hypothetical protein
LVGFPVAVPDLLGPPDKVFYDDRVQGGGLTLLYAPRAALPPTIDREVGALITIFRGQLQPGLFAKVLASGASLREVTVPGSGAGYWITGTHGVYLYFGADNRVQQDSFRLAGNALLFQRGDLTYRFESAVSLGDALSDAGSLR